MGALSNYYGNAVEIFSMFRTSFAKDGVANNRMNFDDVAVLLTLTN